MSVRRALGDLPVTTRDHVLASHGIPRAALERLLADDGEGFITERADTLIARERAFMSEMGIEAASSRSGEAEVDTE